MKLPRVADAVARVSRWGGLSLAAAALPLALGPLGHGGPIGPVLGPWHSVGWREMSAGTADEGLATVTSPSGQKHLLTRGNDNVSPALSARGWSHIGDPGSRNGSLLDVFQGSPGMHAKLFELTSPGGRKTFWSHHDVPGELSNNSFAAIAPGDEWFVGGEWGQVDRLLVYPMPKTSPTARHTSRNLPLTTTVRLTRPVRDVQGCSFASATDLVCATNDPTKELFGTPHQLLRIQLAHPVDGRPDLGTPSLLGPIPQHSRCPGAGEVEGVDISGQLLRILVNEPVPCGGRSVLLTYRRR